MSQKLENPQINLFRNVMSNPAIAQDFLRMRLHPDLLPRIDLDTLEFKKESYVKEQFRHVHSDVVFQCKLDNELIYIYFLIDSQTPPTTLMPFRMLQYKAALMEDHINQGNKVSACYP